MPANTDPDRFDLLEMDNYRSTRTEETPPDDTAARFELLEMDSPPVRPVTPPPVVNAELAPALEDVAATDFGVPADELVDIAPATPHYQGAGISALAADLTAIATQGAVNAAVQSAAAADGAGRLPYVGFRTQDGYITAIRNGVAADVHAEYMGILRTKFKLSGSALAKLNLPGPQLAKVTALPVGEGIKHVPTGPSIFERPKAERAFVVGPKAEQQETTIRRAVTGKELIAGAVAEGHHAIVAWEGTSGLLRGALVGALASINREAWTPSAPNARAQAGSAISALSRGGLHVKPLRKGSVANNGMASGEHTWTVGRVNHAGQVGEEYGNVVVRFKLAGDVLSYEGNAQIAEPVLATFAARMAAEQYKSGDVTSWLARTIRWRLDGVRFGALGWLVPAANVAAATELCKAVQDAGFGSGWVTGLPVATSDQLRDGIANGIIDEVSELMDRLNKERNEARNAKEAALEAARALPGKERLEAQERAFRLDGDIGEKRAHTYLKEFKAIGERVVAYGQVLGEQRVDKAREWVKRGVAELEGIAGEDFSGIRERFGLIWEEIERDRKASGGVL
jgi:hypothetical protein